MNYSQLSTLIQEYCQSTETSFVANIPNFVQLAEERIYNSVQIPALRKTSTASAVIGNQYMSLPSDWLATFSLAIINPVTNVYTFLLNKDVNFMRECFTTATTSGAPAYYAVWDNDTMLLGPTPNLAYTLELNYYYYPASIVDVGTSWLGTNFETVLLYGSLREAYTYLKGEADMVAAYEQKYQEALAQIDRLGDGLDRQDAYRSGQVRLPVRT
jgi:hypothetical protein